MVLGIPPKSHISGRVTVAESNIPVQFTSTSRYCRLIYVQALPTNTGKVAIGAMISVSIAAGQEVGLQLSAGEKIPIEINDPSKMYVNGAAGDGIIYLGW